MATGLASSNFSPTETDGINLLPPNAREVLSVGISTGGIAEMRMAQLHPDIKITATTLDVTGLELARQTIDRAGFSGQIDSKIEDVSEPLPYPDNHFDYIYARLVLHYLSKQVLDRTLPELKRVLKPGKQLFVVVRSVDCPDAHSQGSSYEEVTGITTYRHPVEFGGEKIAHRYFHTEQSIHDHVATAGFDVKYVKSQDERLFADFMRTVISPHTDNLIELLAAKADHGRK